MNLWGLVSVSTSDQEIQGNVTVSTSPGDLDPLLATEVVAIEKLAMLSAVFVDKFCHFHVEATIFSDFHDALFTPPFYRVDADGGLAYTQGGLSDII
jgi:hypothetical protein